MRGETLVLLAVGGVLIYALLKAPSEQQPADPGGSQPKPLTIFSFLEGIAKPPGSTNGVPTQPYDPSRVVPWRPS